MGALATCSSANKPYMWGFGWGLPTSSSAFDSANRSRAAASTINTIASTAGKYCFQTRRAEKVSKETHSNTLSVAPKVISCKTHTTHCKLFWGCTVSTQNGTWRLGWSVGGAWWSRSSLSICNKVVFPALSRPRNTSLPDLFKKPAKLNDIFLMLLTQRLQNSSKPIPKKHGRKL